MTGYLNRQAMALFVRKFAIAGTVALASLATTMPAGAQQVYKASGTGTSPPWNFIPQGATEMQGIAVDLVNAISEDAGFTVQYVEPIVFADLPQALVDGRIDIAAAQVPITPENQQRIGLSTPFGRSGDGLVVLKTDTAEYRSLEDLRGSAIGYVRGAPYLALIERMPGAFSEVKVYETTPEALRAVVSGEVKAALLPAPVAAYTLSQGQYPELKLAPSYQMALPIQVGIGVGKENAELLDKINVSLAKLTANGTVQQIFSKYGLTWTQP